MKSPLSINPYLQVSRRRFVQGLAASAGLAALGSAFPLAAETALPPKELSGTEFDLTIDSMNVNFTGRTRRAMAINGSVPGPVLRWRQGDTVRIAVTNRLRESTSIHWHGLRIPSGMDGVPGLSYAGIAPGERFVYEFPVKQSGTYWYHSHSAFQEQVGVRGAIIIEPNYPDPVHFDREYVILLADWTDEDPHTVFSNLKEQSDYYNFHQQTVPGFFSDARKNGLRATISDRMMWAKMNMSPTDIADVSGATYTYMMNGSTPAGNWTGLFTPGETVRLRFINGSSMTFFDVRIPGLPMTVVAADGNAVQPVTVDEFRIGVAEIYDVVVKPDAEVYTIFAQAEDRTCFARGTLSTRPGITAAVPPMDPRPLRTMADMGMAMKGMKGMDMGHEKAMDHGEDMTDMKGMSGMQMDSKDTSSMEVQAERHMEANHHEMKMDSDSQGRTPLPQPGPGATAIAATGMAMRPMVEAPAALHTGPENAQVASMTSNQLHKPGAGLEQNGRRTLTYADLRALYPGVDRRPPTREIELHLTGNMERFIWGFDGKKFSEAPPIELKLGERVRFVLINYTMMEHPIHLHGLWSELENGNDEFNPYKHTITVKPAERVSYLVSADTAGRWAYHCHLMFHMEAGMFRAVVVA